MEEGGADGRIKAAPIGLLNLATCESMWPQVLACFGSLRVSANMSCRVLLGTTVD